jgi:hypothetical protein
MLLRNLLRCATHCRHHLARRFDLRLELCASPRFLGRICDQPFAFKCCFVQLCTLSSQLCFELSAVLLLRPLLLNQLLAVLSARLLCACRSGLVLRREAARFLQFSC